MKKFEDYFSKEFSHLSPVVNSINPLLTDEKMVLISGDFFGIQKFIFEGLATKNASKMLRAKSAYIQLFTRTAAYAVCDQLRISYNHILSVNAGKFEIIAPDTNTQSLSDLQRRIDHFFITRFFGLSGLGISFVECNKESFANPENYRLLREKISYAIENAKFQKFDLTHHHSVLSYDEGISNETLCKICNIRKSENPKECSVCHDFICLGQKLTKEELISFRKEDGEIEIFDGYYISFSPSKEDIACFDIAKKPAGKYPHWALSSYVHSQNGLISTFEELSQQSCRNHENGIQALGILKADVDNMGIFIRNSDVTDSFENFSLFSQAIDGFFSRHVPDLMSQKYPNTYTVFAGGDDLFLIGAWDQIIELARDIESDFKQFIKNSLSLSMGIIITKPSTPITYLADGSETALENAKHLDGKDAITLFGESAHFKQYREGKQLYQALQEANTELFELPTAFLYRLLELLHMRRNIDKDVVQNALWKSKLSYTFRRNVFERLKENSKIEKAEMLMGILHKMIDKEPEVTKMILSEYIYKRRKSA